MFSLSKKYRFHSINQDINKFHFQLKKFLIMILIIGLFLIGSGIKPAFAAQLNIGKPAELVNFKNQENISTSAENNQAIALRFAQEGWGTNPDWEQAWDQLISADAVYHFNSWPEPIIGLETNKKFNAELFQGFPDIHQTIEDIISQGDKVMYRTTLEGTNTGNFLGNQPTGKSVKVNDFTLLKIADGKIFEWWYECNLLEVMQQLGLVN